MPLTCWVLGLLLWRASVHFTVSKSEDLPLLEPPEKLSDVASTIGSFACGVALVVSVLWYSFPRTQPAKPPTKQPNPPLSPPTPLINQPNPH